MSSIVKVILGEGFLYRNQIPLIWQLRDKADIRRPFINPLKLLQQNSPFLTTNAITSMI